MRVCSLILMASLIVGTRSPAPAFTVLHWEGRGRDFMTNGGFEAPGVEGELSAGWVGYAERRETGKAAVAELSPKAHEGRYSLRLMAEGTNLAGVNRRYQAGRDPGEMIPLAAGWTEFWYRAIASGTGDNLRVYVIAIPEDCGPERGRQAHVIPREHIGDNQWHRGTIHFDFSSNPSVKYAQFAPRINEGGEPGPGELLIDDVAVYPAGPDLAVEVGGFSRPLVRPGDTVSLRGRLRNLGATPASQARARVVLAGPAELVGADEIAVAELPAESQGDCEWRVRVTGAGPITARVTVGGGEGYGETSWPAAMMGVNDTDGLGDPVIETPSARLRYVKQQDEWGTLVLEARPGGAGQWRRAGVMPFLGWAVVGAEGDIVAFPAARQASSPRTWLSEVTDAHGRVWALQATVSKGSKGALRFNSRLRGPDATVRNFSAPWVLIGEDMEKTEACLPGLEYLAADESSSNELDAKYPISLRWAPHPNKVTIPCMSVSYDWGTAGLAWDPLAKWHAENDRPQPIFAVPNRLGDQSSSLFALAVPGSLQGRGENRIEAATPYETAGGELRVAAEVFFAPGANTDAAVAWYLGARGLPADPPLPRSFEEGLRLSLDSSERRWVEDSLSWYPTSWWHRGASPNAFLTRALWIDSLRTTDEARRTLWRSRAGVAAEALGGRVGIDTGLYLGDLWSALSDTDGSMRGLIGSQQEGGGWGFGGNPQWDLGETGKAVSGTTARNALSLLGYAAATGDEVALAGGLKALDFCNRDDPLPRGGQTWEVPLHTPDIIVAGQALMGHILAYEITGEKSWLEQGRHWAYASVPFIYLWQAPERPIMPYATIPVMGTSAWTNPWFGRPVQWCGIAVIHPLQRFAEYDDSQDWAAIARGLIIASMQQQLDLDERVYPDTGKTAEDELYWAYPREDLRRFVGLYPDNFRLFDDRDFCWGYMISPNSHYPLTEALLQQVGIQPGARTRAVRSPQGAVHVTAPLPLREAHLDGGNLTVSLANRQAWPVRVIVARVGEPQSVTVDGRIVPQLGSLEQGEAGWAYRSTLAVCVVQSTGRTVTLNGVSPQGPQAVDTSKLTSWEFDEPGDAGGFAPEHDISVFAVKGGALHVKTSGDDPWFAVHGLQLDAERHRTLRVRLSARAGQDSSLEVFFAHAGEAISAERAVQVPLACDGEPREVAIPVGDHPAWKGTITTVRLDPTHGDGPAEIDIDWIRFE